MNEQTLELPAEIQTLLVEFETLPPVFKTRLQPVVDRVAESARRRRRILCLVQDALSQLRLDMKYIAFDLEATRRERDDYKRRLVAE